MGSPESGSHRPRRRFRHDRNPAGVAAHDLQDHHAVVALGRGPETVQGVGGAGHGGIESEG